MAFSSFREQAPGIPSGCEGEIGSARRGGDGRGGRERQ